MSDTDAAWDEAEREVRAQEEDQARKKKTRRKNFSSSAFNLCRKGLQTSRQRQERDNELKSKGVSEAFHYVHLGPVRRVGKHLMRMSVTTSIQRHREGGGLTHHYMLQRIFNESVARTQMHRRPDGSYHLVGCTLKDFGNQKPQTFDAIWEMLWPKNISDAEHARKALRLVLRTGGGGGSGQDGSASPSVGI